MTPGERAMSEFHVRLAATLEAHQERINALAVQEATLKVQAAEWAAKREELVYWATYGECKRLGWKPPALANVVCLEPKTEEPEQKETSP